MKPKRILISAAPKIDLGKSKFGGSPDLPQGALFPQNDSEEDIPFLCQINLKDFENEIAPSGLLYFFCQLDDTTEYGRVIFVSDEESLNSVTPESINMEYMDIEYPFSEYAISFKEMDEVDRSAEDYFVTMGASRFGGGIFISGADYSKEDRISLLQINTNEIDDLKGNVESILHFFIDKKDLMQKNFKNVLVTSQH
ncbi:DUF1963 domain-containing protein [Leptospira santarosai]|uniref:DUF1963 domain-containing protein n=1 Tax=Leptospira santarosai TaxID=28183 RepID=UPI0002981961|nr:DUF1963 domain-containing protein [Leptospira santarosai]EKS08300.1 PF09234 domain protein [Leptospira santarosai str. JET]MDI7204003.1 DUF1963 domain-containing protein [Leptospira santarosai]